jgi:hypothetical protein
MLPSPKQLLFSAAVPSFLISSEWKKAIQNRPNLTTHKKNNEIVQNNEGSETLSTDSLADEIQINLKEPVFSQGVIKTDQGGIITAEGIRIQAQKIEYTNKIENGHRILKIVAEGDLMMEFGERAFVGQKLEYDFVTKTGTLWQGKTYVDIWFLGGDRIDLKEDGSYVIYNAFVTTCESQDNTWEINSESVKITKDHLLSANNIRFRFFKVPVFWLPSFKSNLKFFSDPPIRYKIVWDKGLGPRATMRYRVFSWEDFNLFFRLDYRLKRGFGAALESEYYSKDERTTFVTRSYGAHDKVVSDERGPRRYRLQGLFSHESLDQKTYTHLTYDKFSDIKMISDFRSSDFEIDTQRRTRLLINHQEDLAFGTFTVQPRLNRFESINQELPLLNMGVRPFNLGKSGILSENYVSAGYLDYVFANELHHSFPFLRDTHSARLETRNRLYRPFSLGPVNLTPSLGIIGIFYNNNPDHTSVGQGVLTYGGEVNTKLYRSYIQYRHIVEPYLSYIGLSRPKAGLSEHFTFNIEDGYFQLNSLRLGVRNALFSLKKTQLFPVLSIDIYTYAFIDDSTFQKTFPKGYVAVVWNRPAYLVQVNSCWNFEEQVLDFFNARSEWTVNENVALILEFRHRSKYDWRKADHQNFILDVARSIEELLDSPLSDGRNTFLSRLQLRLSPKWTCHFESHTGWGRKNDPSYNAFKIDILTLLTCNWRLKFSFTHTPNDDRFSTQIQLAK